MKENANKEASLNRSIMIEVSIFFAVMEAFLMDKRFSYSGCSHNPYNLCSGSPVLNTNLTCICVPLE